MDRSQVYIAREIAAMRVVEGVRRLAMVGIYRKQGGEIEAYDNRYKHVDTISPREFERLLQGNSAREFMIVTLAPTVEQVTIIVIVSPSAAHNEFYKAEIERLLGYGFKTADKLSPVAFAWEWGIPDKAERGDTVSD